MWTNIFLSLIRVLASLAISAHAPNRQASFPAGEPLRSESEKRVYKNFRHFLKRGNIPPLIRAVLNNDKKLVLKLLDQNSPIDATDSFGETALMWATFLEQEATAFALLQHGANPNAIHQTGSHALIEAAHRGNKYLTKLLLSFGANVDLRNRAGETALTVAETQGHGLVFQILAKAWLLKHSQPYE